MVQENEIIMLLLGAGVVLFILNNLPRLQRLPAWEILIAGFGCAMLGWILTILEGFFWPFALNLVEHVCYAASAVVIAIWCWNVFGKGGELV